MLEKVTRYRSVPLDVQPLALGYCRAAKVKFMESPDSPKGSKVSQRDPISAFTAAAAQDSSLSHQWCHQDSLQDPAPLPRPRNSITHTPPKIPKMGQLFKCPIQELPAQRFPLISKFRTSISGLAPFSGGEGVGRSRLGMKRADSPRKAELENEHHPCKRCWNGQECQSSV